MNRNNYLLFAVIAATGILYIPTLGTFLVADSWVFMMPESFIDTFGYFFTSMLPADTNALWLRPIPMFTFWLDRILWPGTMCGPHLLNIVFHCVNIVLIWRIIGYAGRYVSNTKSAPGGAAGQTTACLIYGIHPLTVGAVAWVAARFDVMCVTFGLAAFCLWMKKYESSRTAPILFVSALLMVLFSVLSKEQGVVFLAACIVISAVQYFRISGERKRSLIDIVSLLVLGVLYLVYRLAVFNGLGGYLEARHGLSALPPIYYLAAILFPYMNVIDSAVPTATLGLSLIIVAGLLVILYRSGHGKKNYSCDPAYLVAFAAIVIAGLATNAPNPGMTFERIMGHAESRFALIPITGIALLAGYAAERYVVSKQRMSAVIAVLALWSLTASWRTDAQIQAWRDAGNTARTIVDDTLKIAPEPPVNSRLLFFDIPRTNSQWAYIYGLGLKEALVLKYGRWDIDIVRYPMREDLRNARPDKDFVIKFNESTGHLERLTPHRREESSEK